MKRIMVLIVLFILLNFFFSEAATLNLKATWTPNAEIDMAYYDLYRTDGTRVKINTSPILHPPVLPYLFSITVPDNIAGTATFVLRAIDTSGNQSADSVPASYNYNVDTIPPASPAGFGVTKQ